VSPEEWFPFEPMDRPFPPHHWTASSRKREQECFCANEAGDVFVWWSEAAAQGRGRGSVGEKAIPLPLSIRRASLAICPATEASPMPLSCPEKSSKKLLPS